MLRPQNQSGMEVNNSSGYKLSIQRSGFGLTENHCEVIMAYNQAQPQLIYTLPTLYPRQ